MVERGGSEPNDHAALCTGSNHSAGRSRDSGLAGFCRTHPGAQASAHLGKKLAYLEGKNRVSSAEDFIALGATKSSMTGTAYEVRCPTGVQPAGIWLNTELNRQRQLGQ